MVMTIEMAERRRVCLGVVKIKTGTKPTTNIFIPAS
jgi:hypothetical protein